MTQNTVSTPRTSERTSRSFPLATCLASIVLTSLGLTAAALNIQWGAEPPAADALRQSWLYVQMMLMMTWLLAWPVTAGPRTITNLVFEASAILVGALPAVAIAALLSSINMPAGIAAAALQVSFAICAIGFLRVSARRTPWLIVLPMLAVIMPLLAYVTLEFFPAAWSFWTPTVPAFAIHDAARATDWPACTRTFYVSAIYAAAGILLVAIHWFMDRRTRR